MLILTAHGSRNSHWRASVEKLTELLQADLGRHAVAIAYMDCTPPTLAEVASDAVRAGAERIRVLPLFLTTEGHVDRNIRPLVEEVRQAHEQIEVELLPPVGHYGLFRELLRRIAAEETEEHRPGQP
ncbi:MAG: sirohydrochlorin chelatase [Planctomycetota bacterium]|jgi:sirohydrochlorin cobaltochelatase